MGKGIVALEKQKNGVMVNRNNSIRKMKDQTSNGGIMISRQFNSVLAGGKNHGIQAENYLFEGFLTLGFSCSTDMKMRIQEMQAVTSRISGCFYIFLGHKDAADDLQDFQVFSMSFSHKLLALLAYDVSLCSSIMYGFLRENVISKEELRSVACLRKHNSTMKIILNTFDGFELVSDVVINCILNEEGVCQTLLNLHIDRENIIKILRLRSSTAASELISAGNLEVKKDNEEYEKASREFIKKYYFQELQTKKQVEIINDEEYAEFELQNAVTQPTLDKIPELLIQSSEENKDLSLSLQSPQQFFLRSYSHNSEDEDSKKNSMELLLAELLKKQYNKCSFKSTKLEANLLFINTNLAESIGISSSSVLGQSTEPSLEKSSPGLLSNEEVIFDYNYQDKTSSDIIQHHSCYHKLEEISYDLKLSVQQQAEVQINQNDYLYNDHYYTLSPPSKLNWNSDDDFFSIYQ